MTEMRTRAATPGATLSTIFARLFENEFATLDSIAISQRSSEGMDYIDQTVALQCWLEGTEPAAALEPADPAAHVLHQALYAALPEYDCVISGLSRHLQALLLEDQALPQPTSMMRKRGISDLSVHLVEPDALTGTALAGSIARARDIARRNEMRHVLLVTGEGMVVVAGSPPFEAMAHWHNVEFAARIACMALEDAAAQATAPSPPSAGGPLR